MSASEPPKVEPGVSLELARWRAAHYGDIRYELNITLEKMAPLMKGELEIRVTLDAEGAKNNLILDWRTTAYKNDKDKPYAHVIRVNNLIDVISQESNEHLIVPSGGLKVGENVIKIQFASPIKTSGSAITRYIDKEDGSEYIYSLFVPSDASTAFPVFDQPDLKAVFDLSVTFPSDWEVVTNTRFTGFDMVVEQNHCVKDCVQRRLNFAATKPISTYVFAFAAGNFEAIKECFYLDTIKGKDILKCLDSNEESKLYPRIYVRKSQAEKFKPHAAEVFRLNREAVKFYEEYFDFKFPFPKYDLVLIPEFPFGGMEHAGATFLRENSIIFPSEPTKNDYISRANLIFHEAAHQWFGDTVTMKWFDDLWLKEGFATFAGYKAMEKIMPEYDAWKVFYERTKQAAYQTDSTKGTTPIYQEITNLSAAKSAYGAIVYNKAPAFLRQAEFYLGEKEFQTAVRSFLKKHEYANAGWEDLVNEFETSTNAPLKAWANIWVKKPGLARIKIGWHDDMGKRYGHGFNNSWREEEEHWGQKLKLATLTVENQFSVENVLLGKGIGSGRGKSLGIPGGERYQNYFFPNYGDYGYGIFLPDQESRDYILKNIQNEKDDFLRAMMWGSLWDSVREAELDPKSYVELAIKNISVETDVTTIQTIVGRVGTAMNYYLGEADANALAPKLEALLFEKMKSSATPGERITYYRAFLNAARSDSARKTLKDILSGERFTVAGSPATPALPALRTKDRFDIVTRLAILGDSDASKLLAELSAKETSDDAKRYAYAVGAGFGSKEAKEKYFNDFLTNKEISESWIEAATSPFNSIKHAELTLPYLEKALAELPNLKRNRKIFFVNGWLGAFIGGQKSGKALGSVNKFLADNPNLDKDLRLKILENVDVIERAVKIRATFSGK